MVHVDSDTLYVLATGISIVSIVVVVAAKYWFGGKSGSSATSETVDKTDEELKKGEFGRFPIAEWKQHKSALDKEFQDRFMEKPEPPKPTMETEDKTPLLAEEEDIPEATDAKASPGANNKMVRFQDVGDGLRRSSMDKGGETEQPFDEDLEGILHEKMDENELAHLPGQLKSVKLRKATKQLEEGLTDEQKEEEARVRNEQLASILTLMRQQEEKFGNSSMEDIEEQLKLYNIH